MSGRITFRLLNSFRKINCYSSCYSKSLFSSTVANLASKSNVAPEFENIQVSKLHQPFLRSSAEEILSSIDPNNTSVNENVIILKTLRLQVLFNPNGNPLCKSDSRFLDLCRSFEKNCLRPYLKPSLLISGLRSLLEIGVPPESNVVVAAENNILNNVQEFSIFNLVGCLYFHQKFMKTDLQEKVVKRIVQEIHFRLFEMTLSSEILLLAHVYHKFDDTFRKDVEEKIVELVPSLTLQELCKLVSIFSENNNRTVSILNSISFYIRQSTKELDIKEAVDLFYSLKTLSFYNPKLYGFLMNGIEKGIPSVTEPALISKLLTVCGQLRWRQAGILDSCAAWITKNIQNCGTKEYVAFILAAGALNYSSEQTKRTIDLLIPHLTLQHLKSPVIFLDVAFSLGILDCIPKEMLLEVINPDFYKTLIGDSSSYSEKNCVLKLLNLKGVLKKKFPEYVFKCNLFLDPIQLEESSDISSCRQHVLEVLSNFVPSETCLAKSSMTETGISVDAEFILNSDMQPLSLKNYGTMAGSTKKKPLPQNSKRVALQCMFHKDYTLCSSELTGVNALGVRLLEDAGYAVVVIPYNEFSRNKTEIQKAKYLLEKISSVVKNT